MVPFSRKISGPKLSVSAERTIVVMMISKLKFLSGHESFHELGPQHTEDSFHPRSVIITEKLPFAHHQNLANCPANGVILKV